MRKLVEVTHVSLGREIDPLDWAFPYLDSEHEEAAPQMDLLDLERFKSRVLIRYAP
jgi:hypothetical protein